MKIKAKDKAIEGEEYVGVGEEKRRELMKKEEKWKGEEE